MFKIFRRKKAFTIIELLVVCSIIAVLASMTIASYAQSQIKSRDSRRKADLETVSQAVIMFRAEYKTYPGNGKIPNTDDYSFKFASEPTITATTTANQLSQFTRDLLAYLPVLPHDPKPSLGKDYYYKKTANGYRVYSILENSNESGYQLNTCKPDLITYNYTVPGDDCNLQ